jgi:hypothetical protein
MAILSIEETIGYVGRNTTDRYVLFSGSGGNTNLQLPIDELRAAVAAYDRAATPTPVPAPSGDPVVGTPYRWDTPVSNLSSSILPTQVIKDQTFTNTNTALLAEVADSHSGRIYVRCTFVAGRYAAYLQGQRNMAFIDCTFVDSLGAVTDEACVRLQSCTNILFLRTTIRAFGPKHAFRVHGLSRWVSVQGMDIHSRGNGIMCGRYSAEANPTTSDVEMKDVVMYAEGPDVLNLSTDGTLRNFRAADFTITTGQAGAWYRGPAAGLGADLGFTFANIRRL